MEKSIRLEFIGSVDWNNTIKTLPDAHFLQTEEWSAIKSRIGWESEKLVWRDEAGTLVAAANLLIRKARIAGNWIHASVGYVPRGPILNWEDDITRNHILNDLQKVARQKKLVFLKIDPVVELGRGIPGETDAQDFRLGARILDEMASSGWKYSPDQIQFKNTVVVDLAGSEETWLARMKQKTRYNIRLAQKNGVVVRRADGNDLEMMYRMYAETALRDGFIIRPRDYYLEVWNKFMDGGMAEGLLAEVNGEPVAGLIFFYFGQQAWYVYGMSAGKHREKMPNYLLQWEAMRSAANKGCQVYDLWGAPNDFVETDPMFGVYRFKDGLGGEVVRTIGAWDYANNRFLYFLYQVMLPQFLSITRKIRRRQIEQEVL